MSNPPISPTNHDQDAISLSTNTQSQTGTAVGEEVMVSAVDVKENHDRAIEDKEMANVGDDTEKDGGIATYHKPVAGDVGQHSKGEESKKGNELQNDEGGEKKAEPQMDESKILKGKALGLVFIGMLLSVFLISLDQTIIAPALPVIASHFKALDEIGWIASCFLLTNASFMLLYGSTLQTFDRKWVFILAVSLFELGSLFCAIAPSVEFLIFGRAVAGAGAGGIFVSVFSIIAESTRLDQRPLFFGAFGAVFGASSIIGPLMGGAFTDHVSWRWCFYINLPVGAVTVVTILVFIQSSPAPLMSRRIVQLTERRFGWLLNIVDPRRKRLMSLSPEMLTSPLKKNKAEGGLGDEKKGTRHWSSLLKPPVYDDEQEIQMVPSTLSKEPTTVDEEGQKSIDMIDPVMQPERQTFLFRILGLDLGGTIIVLGLVTCLVLPLQWAGNKYAWDDPIIISLLCATAVLIAIFVYYEWRFAGPAAILPLHFLRNKTQVACCIMAFFVFFSMMVGVYYLPLQYQAVKNHSATKSGIDILPLMIGTIAASGVSGGIITATGNYWEILVVTPLVLSVGAGLLYTLDENSSTGELVGYQIITSIGIGAVMQNNVIAIQANVKKEADVPQATSLVTFMQLVGGVLGIAIGQTIFNNQLGDGLHKYAPDAPFDLVRSSVEVIYTLPVDMRPGVIHAYVKALDYVYLVGVPAGGLASISAFFIKRKNIKGQAMVTPAA